MGIEHNISKGGSDQIVESLDEIIKIGDRYLQVRLINTRKWQSKDFTHQMPRARFIKPEDVENINYIVSKDTILRLKKEASASNRISTQGEKE